MKNKQSERRREYLEAVGRRELEVINGTRRRVLLVSVSGERIPTYVVRQFAPLLVGDQAGGSKPGGGGVAPRRVG